MVIDTSALIAILTGEPEQLRFNSLIATALHCSMSAGTYLETSIVIGTRFGLPGTRQLAAYLAEAGIRIVPFDGVQADIAKGAYERYGKGHHPAGLNFGDCFAYALAKLRAEPLLCKGDDFVKTDLTAVR